VSFVTFVWQRANAKSLTAFKPVTKLSNVTSRIARAVVVLALCLSFGAHWVVLQSVAWGRMVVEYAQRVPLAEAVAQTFDGNHPCNLCKDIYAVRHSEKKSDTQSVTAKPDLICATRRIILLPRYVEFLFARLKMNAELLPHSPPTPPPRSELI
jgi:hypothetical protein